MCMRRGVMQSPMTMTMLLLKLRNRCVVFFRRREQLTSTQAAQRPSCKDAAITACLSSMSILGGVFVIVTVIYAVNSPDWIDVGVQSLDCDEVRPSATVEAASPRLSADVRGSSDVRDTGTADPGKTSTPEDQLSRCTGHMYVGAWTICAIYASEFHNCGKTS